MQCLKFLERHEQRAFQNHEFKRIWMDTDQLLYYLNNVKKRGHGGERYEDAEEPIFQTSVLVSGDVFSKYIFRADVAYDWQTTLDDIQLDTITFKEDHMNEFGRKNARLRFSFAPQPPTKNDTQSQWDYIDARHEFDLRRKYIDGMHVDATYTAIAHYWLIRQMINAEKWRFVSDEDGSLMTALYRVFKDEIRDGRAHHFLCKVDRSKTKQEAYMEYKDGRENLVRWGRSIGETKASLSALAKKQLEVTLRSHKFYEVVTTKGDSYKNWAKNPLEHPLPTVDKGYYTVDCTTDISGYTPEHLAALLLNVNNNTTNGFMQQIRRRLSILERPLVTARGDGKS